MTNLQRKYFKQQEERLIRIYLGEHLEYLADKIETNFFNKYAEVKEKIGIRDGKIFSHKYCDVSVPKNTNCIRIRFSKEECDKVKDSIIRVFDGMIEVFDIEIKYDNTFDYYYIELDVKYLVKYYYHNVINKTNERLDLKSYYKENITKGILFYLDKDSFRGTGKTRALKELQEEGYIVLNKETLRNPVLFIPNNYKEDKDFYNVLVDEDIDINTLRGFNIQGKRIRVIGGFANSPEVCFRYNCLELGCEIIDLNNYYNEKVY